MIIGLMTLLLFSFTIVYDEKKDEQDVRNLVNKIFTIAGQQDMKTVESFHLKSPKFSKWDDQYPDIMDYDQNTVNEKEAFSALKNFTFQIPINKVSIWGKTAIAAFLIHGDATVNGNPLHFSARGTLVFVKEHGQWKIVHEHFSPYTKQ